jgi:uncharacterized protein (TIGR03083 family)
MDAPLAALGASVTRLQRLVAPLDENEVQAPAYPAAWSIADVLSHIGSGAVIMERRLDDALAGHDTPDDFAQSVWDEWNAKTQGAKVTDGLAADAQLLERFRALTDEQRASLKFTIGPLSMDLSGLVGLRLNEHALHTWDVEVVLDPVATVSPDATQVVVDNLELIARYTGRAAGPSRTIAVATRSPARRFTIDVGDDAVRFEEGEDGAGDADVTLPAEAFVRLVYGRLDPGHTPTFEGDAALLDQLRAVFPGP